MHIDRRELRWANLMAMLCHAGPNSQPSKFGLSQVSLALPAGDMVIEGDAGSPQPYPKDFIGFLDFLAFWAKTLGLF
jgi:hypothetical protein